MYSRMFSTITGLYPQDTSDTAPVMKLKMSPDIINVPWEAKSSLKIEGATIISHCVACLLNTSTVAFEGRSFLILMYN